MLKGRSAVVIKLSIQSSMAILGIGFDRRKKSQTKAKTKSGVVPGIFLWIDYGILEANEMGVQRRIVVARREQRLR